jgi:hypothetical protein
MAAYVFSVEVPSSVEDSTAVSRDRGRVHSFARGYHCADSEPGREADAEQDSEEVPVRGRCTALITWMLLLGRGYHPLFYPSIATYPHSGSPNSGTTNEAIYSNCHSLAYISVSLLCRYRIQYKLKDRRTPRLNQVSADEPLVISIDSLPSVSDLRLRPKNDLRLVFLPAPTTCVVPFALSFGL